MRVSSRRSTGLGRSRRLLTQHNTSAGQGTDLVPYWSLFTSLFLHGGWVHLIGNMWTLWIFGDNVEDRMGPGRFTLFYLACGLAAGVCHVLFNPGSTIPSIGASGAIAGVMGAYLVLFLAEMAIAQVPACIRGLLADNVGPERAEGLASKLSEGGWTHDHPIGFAEAR